MKKGMIESISAAILSFTVMILLLAFMIYNVGPGLKGISNKQLCMLSAVAMANTKILGAESPIIRDLKCETKYIKIKPDSIDLYDNGKYRRNIDYRDFKSDPDKYTQKVVADEMYECWKYLGAGKIDPFGKYDDTAKCVMCSQIQFDPEMKKKKYDFYTFLKQNYVNDESGAKTTYWDYMTNGAVAQEGDELSIELANEEPQTVVFISIKPNALWEIGGTMAAAGAGATACTTFPPAVKTLGSVLGKIPKVGPWAKGLGISAKMADAGRASFALGCKSNFLKNGKVVQRGSFIIGSAISVQTASGEEEPRILGVELVPTADVGKECGKLYG